jgi:hypothetical protein
MDVTAITSGCDGDQSERQEAWATGPPTAKTANNFL